MLYTPTDILALLLVSAGISLQSWFGIGFGLVAAPLLYLINPAYVPAPVLILGFCLSLLMVRRTRGQVQWSRITPAILARLPGAWLGAVLLAAIPGWSLSLLFGVCLLAAAGLTWRLFKVRATRRNMLAGGFFSGLTGTATSIGGPPIALVYQELDRIEARNELAMFFLLGTPFSLLALLQQGVLDLDSLQLSLKLLPGLLLGFWIGNRFDGRIPATSAKPVLLSIALLSALLIIGKGIIQWWQS
ncbi:sulfite exporter TauE/SafE family protein [Neptuniibacter halophilus]|uniref:sulfite exporter TauE/SafE family protein n=1 Tax=Neptuniibacter halophilus TaxID=651666 RepID=UPI002573B057|nr:sulfite exporter TauE/SafE family protein [Neptuniibacter halophilus]